MPKYGYHKILVKIMNKLLKITLLVNINNKFWLIKL